MSIEFDSITLYRKAKKRVKHWHTIQRSRLFVILPASIFLALIANFAWETVRVNSDEAAVKTFPLRFTVIDLPTTVNLVALMGGLMLARAQFARTIRPHFGYSWTEFEQNKDRYWNLHFYNGGPGHAQIKAVLYRVAFYGGDGHSEDWIEFPRLSNLFTSRGLVPEEVDLFWLGRAPLVPHEHATDGFRLASFNYRALAALELFDVKILATDSVGDLHTLHIPTMSRLPPTARMIVEQIHANAQLKGADAAQGSLKPVIEP